MPNTDVNTSASSVDIPDEGDSLAAEVVQEPQTNADEGQIQAIQAERERRQTAERERDEAIRTQNYYKSLAENQQVHEPQTQVDPDDWATNKDVQNFVAQEVGKITKQSKEQRTQEQLRVAKASHPDFDEAFNYALDLARETPGLEDSIMASANPAETAYRLGKTHDSYAKKEKSKATADVVNKINEGMQQPQTLSNVSAANNTPQNDSEKIAAMSDSEFEAYVYKVKTGQ